MFIGCIFGIGLLPSNPIVSSTLLLQYQDPHEKATYYWRLRQHDQHLRKIGVRFASVEALMSRDFLVRCDNPELERDAQVQLESACADDGAPLLEVDNRGSDLFTHAGVPRPHRERLPVFPTQRVL